MKRFIVSFDKNNKMRLLGKATQIGDGRTCGPRDYMGAKVIGAIQAGHIVMQISARKYRELLEQQK